MPIISNFGGVKIDASPTNGSTNAVSSDGVYDALSDKIRYGISLGASDNLNNCTTPGLYVWGSSSIPDGVPEENGAKIGQHAWMLVLSRSGGLVNQYIRFGQGSDYTNKIYERHQNNSAWSAWRAADLFALPTSKQDLITASGVLQGNGSGGITAKGVDTVPAASSSNLITSGAVNSYTFFQQPNHLTSSDSLNDLTTPGIYGWSNSIPPEAPGGYCWLLNLARPQGGYITQICRYGGNANRDALLYERHSLQGGGWSDWRSLDVFGLGTSKQNTITANGVLQGDGSGGITARTVATSAASGSTALITSGAVYSGLSGKQASITANGVLQGNGSGGITARTVEATAATSGSTDLITSGAVYSGLSSKVNTHGKGINLLDNWDFRTANGFPINSRGKTTYSGANQFCVDRWYISSYLALKKTDNYWYLQNTGASSAQWGRLDQTVEGVATVFNGQTATVSVSTPYGVFSATGTIDASAAAGTAICSTTLHSSGQSLWLYRGNGDSLFARLRLNYQADNMIFYAVKLELGGSQTLCDANGNIIDPPPDREFEVAKCRLSHADSSDTYTGYSEIPLDAGALLPKVELNANPSQQYKIGEYFIRNNTLNKAIADLATTSTFAENTNFKAATLAYSLGRIRQYTVSATNAENTIQIPIEAGHAYLITVAARVGTTGFHFGTYNAYSYSAARTGIALMSNTTNYSNYAELSVSTSASVVIAKAKSPSSTATTLFIGVLEFS